MNDKPEAVAWLYTHHGSMVTVSAVRYEAAVTKALGYTETALYPEPPSQDASALVEAAKALCDAIAQDNRIGGWYIDADDPEALACNLHSALTAWEAQHG